MKSIFEKMKRSGAGEWLVTVGEGVGVTASILAMAKRLSWNDWLLFSEKCGMPVILANTNAQQDTPAWKALENAVAAIAPKTGLLADNDSKIQAVPIGGSSGQTTYRELVETVDRAISSLYRGGDLATMSMGGEGVGTNAQDGESELMDADGCAMIGETLQEQIERHVIRFTCGDFEPLAGIVINPPAETEDIDREIKIDQHLGEFGVKLSKKDMLARYGRTEATDDTDAATRTANGGQGLTALPSTSLFNEKSLLVPAGQRQAAGQQSQGQDNGNASEDVLKAFANDTGPAADAIKELLKNPSREACEKLLSDLPSLLPDNPALAAVIAEEMAKQFGASPLANEMQHCPKDGGWIGDAGCTHPNHQHSELVKRILSGEPKTISTHEAESALKEGFYVSNPEGKRVGFGKRLLAHLETHLEGDSNARKMRLMFAVHAVSHPDRVEKDHKGIDGRTLYAKAFEGFGMVAISAKDSDDVESVFTIVPNRRGKKK